MVAETLEYLATTAMAGNETDRAAWMLGAAAAIRETNGIPQPPPERSDTESVMASARQALGEAALMAAFGTGQALSLEEAIAKALDTVNQGERLRLTHGKHLNSIKACCLPRHQTVRAGAARGRGVPAQPRWRR